MVCEVPGLCWSLLFLPRLPVCAVNAAKILMRVFVAKGFATTGATIALNGAVGVVEFSEFLSWSRAAVTVQACLSNRRKLCCHRICEDMRLGRS